MYYGSGRSNADYRDGGRVIYKSLILLDGTSVPPFLTAEPNRRVRLAEDVQKSASRKSGLEERCLLSDLLEAGFWIMFSGRYNVALGRFVSPSGDHLLDV